jgi:hypothetical protein
MQNPLFEALWQISCKPFGQRIASPPFVHEGYAAPDFGD